MDVITGAAHIVGPTGLAPVAWLNNGAILGTLSAAGANCTTTSFVVVIDPNRGRVATILGQSTVVFGVA